MLYIQLIGFLGFLVYTLSYSRSTYNKVLLYQLTANSAYTIHYFLLGGISASFVCAIDMLKDLTYMNLKKDRYKCAFILICLYALVTYIFYENPASLLPFLGSSVSVFVIAKNDTKWLLKGGIITASMWLPYNILVHSYSGTIAEIIIITSAVINLIRMQKQEKEKLKKHLNVEKSK